MKNALKGMGKDIADANVESVKAVENLSQSYTLFLSPMILDSTCKSDLFTTEHVLEIHRKIGAHGVFEKSGSIRTGWLEMSTDVRLVPCLIKHALDDLLKHVREELYRCGHDLPEIDRTRALIRLAAHLITQFCYIEPFEAGNDAVLRFLVAYLFNQITMVPIVQSFITPPINPDSFAFEDQILTSLKETNQLIADAFGHKLKSKPIIEKSKPWRHPIW